MDESYKGVLNLNLLRESEGGREGESPYNIFKTSDINQDKKKRSFDTTVFLSHYLYFVRGLMSVSPVKTRCNLRIYIEPLSMEKVSRDSLFKDFLFL